MAALIKIFIIIQAVITLVGFLILKEGRDMNSAASFAAGSFIVLINVLFWAFSISRLVKKKLIALSVVLIVFKYAILGVIVYELLSYPWIDKLWFCVGLGSLVVSALFFASFTAGGGSDDEEEKFTS